MSDNIHITWPLRPESRHCQRISAAKAADDSPLSNPIRLFGGDKTGGICETALTSAGDLEMPPWKTEYIPGRPRIAVDRMGSGPLLVFLHGIGGNRSNWHEQLPDFSRHFNAVSWDGRGYGDSEDYEGPLDFSAFSDDLLRLLDYFDARKAHLVGLSMGGVIALDFYQRHAPRVATLTICDSLPGMSGLSAEQRAEFIRLRQEPLLHGKEPADIAPTVARTLISESAPPSVFQRLVASMTALHKQSYLKTIAGMANYTVAFELERIAVPCHFVVGAEDRLTPPATSRAMAERVAGAELTVIEHAGHLSNIEQPEAFNRAVLDFLLRHPAQRT
jgi:3-oxoadipate enol-lactonase